MSDDEDDEFPPLSNEERSAHVHKLALFSIRRGKPGDLVWALQYVITNHTYDTTHRSKSKPNDPGWHECRCGLWEGYWSGYNEHVAEDQVKVLTDAGLLRQVGLDD